MLVHLRFPRLFLTLLVLVFNAANRSSAEEPADSPERDYSQELPRIPPTPPQSAISTFQVAPGFRLEQVAAEPLVADPVAIAFDENGRAYVVEMLDYSENDKDHLGQVRLLEDTNGDGRFDKSTIFVDGLSWPTAVVCHAGGVLVGAAPHLFFFKDTDGDGKADIRQNVFTGFQRNNVQGLLNSFHWGLDNRVHIACSSNGAEIMRLVEQLDGVSGVIASPLPTTPLVLRGRDVAFDPRTLQLLATSGGAQHGMSFNEWGDKFVCSNSDHIQLVMYQDRYIARNPYLVAPAPRVSIAADGPQADVFRRSPVEPWRIVRTRLRLKGVVPGPVEGGGRASGYFTSATGVTIFTGNAWRRGEFGLAFMGDVGSNIIHRKQLEPDGLGLIARRIDDKQEFVASTDIWFRPVQFANAPDGTLYVLDMYREVIEHPASLPPAIKKHLDLTSGRDRGRIYRVVPEGFQQPKLPQLGSATTLELVAGLAHTNGWHRETALRLLWERQDRSAILGLVRLTSETELPEGRIHALCALDGQNALSPEVLLRALNDRHERVREHAVRLSEKLAAESPELRQKLLTMGADESLRVRYQLAFSLGELSDVRRVATLATIAKRDDQNLFIKTAVLSSVAESAGDLMRFLAEDAKFLSSDAGRDWLSVLATQIGKQQRTEDVAVLLSVLHTTKDSPKALQAIVQGLAAKPSSDLEQQVAAATGGRAEQVMAELISKAAKTAGDVRAIPANRIHAIHQLRLGRFDEREQLFTGLLEPTQPSEVQTATLATLASFTDPKVGALIIRQWSSLSPRIRTVASDVMFSRSTWLQQLLDVLVDGTIASGDIEPGRLTLLAQHRDDGIRKQAAQLLGRNTTNDRLEVFESYRDTLTMKGDIPRGKEVFKKVCAACHQLEKVGFPLGPNLAAMKNRGAEAVLTNVIMPNREVNPQYLNYIVTTEDGRTLSGMIVAETATSLTLKRAENVADEVLRVDIEELRSTGVSLMPEGMEKQIDKQAMADVIEYLKSLD